MAANGGRGSVFSLQQARDFSIMGAIYPDEGQAI
jgi:hypothetical protein